MQEETKNYRKEALEKIMNIHRDFFELKMLYEPLVDSIIKKDAISLLYLAEIIQEKFGNLDNLIEETSQEIML